MSEVSRDPVQRTSDANGGQPVRVLHVIRDLFAAGGTPRLLLSLARASAGSGVTHAFLVFGDTEDTLAGELRAAGSPVVVVARRSPIDFRLIGDIARVARDLDTDVIGTHCARADVLGVVAARRLRLPVVKHLHAIIVNESPLVRSADRVLGRYRAAVICNSEATLQAEVERSRVGNAVVVLLGVEDARPPAGSARERVRAALGIGADEFLFGHIGGLMPLRDQHLLVEAVAILHSRGQSASCVIVGDGPERSRLQAFSRDRGVEDRVIFCGYRDDVPDLLASMDAYVNMCRAEGFGIAVVEAMQAGLPVIVADAGALPELVEHDSDGLIVRAGDAEGLAIQLLRLARDPELRGRLGKAACESARARFSVGRYALEMNDVYRAAASASRGGESE
jgi:glycosyltransferase involved in cell wall biosynthesis